LRLGSFPTVHYTFRIMSKLHVSAQDNNLLHMNIIGMKMNECFIISIQRSNNRMDNIAPHHLAVKVAVRLDVDCNNSIPPPPPPPPSSSALPSPPLQPNHSSRGNSGSVSYIYVYFTDVDRARRDRKCEAKTTALGKKRSYAKTEYWSSNANKSLRILHMCGDRQYTHSIIPMFTVLYIIYLL